MPARQVKTTHCAVAVEETAGPGPPILLIHGNSSCKEVFRNQLHGTIGETFRCIAMDLPGHGASEDATDPEQTYTMSGHADTALQVADALGLDRFAIVNGADEPMVNNAYIQGIAYANLWENHMHLVPNTGHAPFWEAPADFDSLLRRFVLSLDVA